MNKTHFQQLYEKETGKSSTYETWSEKYQEMREGITGEYFEWIFSYIDKLLADPRLQRDK